MIIKFKLRHLLVDTARRVIVVISISFFLGLAWFNQTEGINSDFPPSGNGIDISNTCWHQE